MTDRPKTSGMQRTPGRPRSGTRRFLIRVAWVMFALLAIPTTAAALLWSRAETSNIGQLEFERELTIPPLLEPTEDEAGNKVFDLEMREGTSELLAGEATHTWGFNGPYLGPTLRASRGDRVQMRVRNALPETSTVHWHGMHLPAPADGGPHQTIEPGEIWSPSWTIDQPAASLWYHPHMMGETEEHVYRGLAGMFILDDPRSDELELPSEYGVDDIPLIVQDKRFEEDGELSDSQGMISPIGQLGDEILVNGTSDPYLRVTTTRVRLRLLNASTARSYNFGFADDRAFDLIATEGGLLEAPEPMNRIQLSPGERAEIVVEVEPGEEVVLRSFEPDLGGVDFFNEAHVHLGPLAVDAHLQGQGIGSLIVQEHCRRLDMAREVGYLETDKRENVRFYERFGFEVIAEAPVIGVPNWFMRREPRSAGP